MARHTLETITVGFTGDLPVSMRHSGFQPYRPTGVRLLRRRSIRLVDYDYRQQGAYFVTICSHDQQCIFSIVGKAHMRLTPVGDIVVSEWLRTEHSREDVELDHFVVMPNHFHAILVICNEDMAPQTSTGRSSSKPQSRSLSSVIGSYKSAVSRRVHSLARQSDLQVWQGNCHEHVIRSEQDLNRLRQYIINNPLKWEMDRYFREE